MNSAYFNNVFSETIKKCLDNDINDYKTCYEFHKFKHNDFLLEGIKYRYDMMKSFEYIIKDCIENKKNHTECYYSMNKFGYFNEFNYMYNKMNNKN